jgi:hypothetical protein
MWILIGEIAVDAVLTVLAYARVLRVCWSTDLRPPLVGPNRTGAYGYQVALSLTGEDGTIRRNLKQP